MPTASSRATPPAATSLKPLADVLARYEGALGQWTGLLKGTEHDETHRILHSMLDSVKSTNKLVTSRTEGLLLLPILTQTQAHLQMVALLLVDVDLSAQPRIAEQFRKLKRDLSNVLNETGHMSMTIFQA